MKRLNKTTLADGSILITDANGQGLALFNNAAAFAAVMNIGQPGVELFDLTKGQYLSGNLGQLLGVVG